MNNKKTILIALSSFVLSFSAQAIQNNAGLDVWYDADGFQADGSTNNLWNSGEPNDSSGEDCGVLLSNGTFNDADCGGSRRVLCFNGSQWQLSAAATNMGPENNANNDFGGAAVACPAGYQFAAPTNPDEIADVQGDIPGVNDVWINLSDKAQEGRWRANIGVTVKRPSVEASKDTLNLWAPGEPNNSGDCGQIYTSGSAAGFWDDAGCSGSAKVACYNPVNEEWRVTAGSYNMGNNDTVGNGAATTACSTEFGAGFEFSAPKSLADTQAIDAASNDPSVWINLQDKEKENIWVFNQGTAFGASPWLSGQPDNSGDCVAAVGAVGEWNDLACSDSFELACQNRQTKAWQLTNAAPYTTTLEMQRLCAGLGKDFEFAAPVTPADVAALNSVRAPANDNVWINVNDQQFEGFWQINWGKENWAAGHPVNPEVNQCAQIRISDGKWISADCESRAKILCSDGDGWRLGDQNIHQYTNTALIACPRVNGLTNRWQLATPRANGEIEFVSQYLQSQSGSDTAWINGRYLKDVGYWSWNSDKGPYLRGGDLSSPVWYDLYDDTNRRDPRAVAYYEKNRNFQYSDTPAGTPGDDDNERLFNYILFLNTKAFAYWNAGEPNFSGRCTQMYVDNDGKWDDTGCNTRYKVACSDGFEWRISPVAAQVNPAGNSTDSSENIDSAQQACAMIEKDGVAGNFKFAAPLSFVESLRLQNLAQKEGVNRIWINVQSLRFEGTWKYNKDADIVAPFWNTNEPNNAAGGEDCAELTTSGLWNDAACSSQRALACYDPYDGLNGRWQLTAATNFVGGDLITANKACEQIGSRYKYYAPVNLSQNQELTSILTGSSVWINANDLKQENGWVLNSNLNNWRTGQPAGSISGNCVSANAQSSQWQVRDCSVVLPVACSTGGRWLFTNTAVSLDDFAAGQRQCDALGEGLLFAAPRNIIQFESFRYYAEQQGLGGDFWINGYRQGNGDNWNWNIQQLYVPAWGADEPDGNGSETCATLSAANWADQACGGNFKYLCRDSAGNWAVSAVSGSLNDFSDGVLACQALGAGWTFAAPETYNDNLAAQAAIPANEQVWLNATDALKEGRWLLNSASIGSTNSVGDNYSNWLNNSPGNDVSSNPLGEDCAYQDNNGQWSAISCSVADNYPWACTDGTNWRVTSVRGRIQQFSDGHKACFNEFGGRYIFAVPLSKDDAIQLDFARKLSAQENNLAVNRVWLNLTDGGNEGVFRYNLPFVNWPGAVYPPGVEPINNCIRKGATPIGSNNPWQIVDCVTQAAHYACFSGSSWKIATSEGALIGGSLQIIPQVGKDYWSYERGNQLCKEQHGSEYYFSAPVTAAEELALDKAIRNADAQTRNTWINYYYVRSLVSDNNRWFADRVTLGNWQKTEFDNFSGSDCAALKKQTDTHAIWQDAQCNSAQLSYACLNLNDASWQITPTTGNWSKGFEVCEASGGLYAAPRSADELNTLLAGLAVQGSVWVNASDTAVESQWIVNRLRSAWWAESEPRNNGNKDCAVINPSTGLWQATKCNIQEYQFACRAINGSNIEWRISSAKGLWSQGFGVCAREFEGFEFMAPVGYGNTLAKVEQDSLAALVTGSATTPVWINYSDQHIESAWRTERAYSDWGVASLLDEQNDCGYFDRVIEGSGTWYADRCKYTSGSAMMRGFACTDGYEWRLVQTVATVNQRWSAGFDACQSLGSEWVFSAPSNGADNAKLKLAMELAGQSQAWINIQDRTGEGEWQINGPQTNFPIEIEVVADTTVAEQTNNIELRANLIDDEEQPIPAVAAGVLGWELMEAESDLGGFTAADFSLATAVLSGDTANGSGVLTATYSTPRLFKNDLILVFRVYTTDTKPGPSAEVKTSEARIAVTVKAPLLAAYDFNDPLALNKDISGNGHDAFNSQAYPLPPVNSGALQLTQVGAMRVAGTATDPVNGLDLPADEYTIAFRISIEEDFDDDGESTNWRGILQKGAIGERQPGLFLYAGEDRLHARGSTNIDSNRGPGTADEELVAVQQWINIVYVKRMQPQEGFDVYIDDMTIPAVTYDYPAGETAVGNTSDLWIGQVPGAPVSFVGQADDIFIFNRVLNAQELASLLPAPPVGEIAYIRSASSVDENAGTTTVEVERRRGYRGPFSATFSLNPNAPTTATVGDVINVAAVDAGLVDAGIAVNSVTLDWNDREKGSKTFTINLDSTDDGLREGAERVDVLIDSATDNQISSDNKHILLLDDVTPNPNGNFSIYRLSSPAELPDYSSVQINNAVVLETDNASQYLCVVRESGGVGEVAVNYILSGSASRGADGVNDDYNLVGGANRVVPPAGASVSGQLVFADGDQSPRCFEVVVYNHAAEIGEVDRTIDVELTSVSPTDSSNTPVLTQDRNANLVIRDYAVGKIEFATASGTCWEPNDADACSVVSGDDCLPDTIESQFNEQDACEVTVVRSGIGTQAPAQTVTLNISAFTGTNDLAGSDIILNFPAVSPTTPATAASETQVVPLSVISDNSQEALDEVGTLTLNGNTTDLGSQTSYDLTLKDVTTPAVISVATKADLAGKNYQVEDGQPFDIDVIRTGNPQTEFTLTRELTTSKTGNCDITDLLDFSAGSPGDFTAATSTQDFARNGGNQSWQVKPRKVYDLGENYTVSLTLSNPLLGAENVSRVVGFGSAANANDTSPSTVQTFTIGGDDSDAIENAALFNGAAISSQAGGQTEDITTGIDNTFYAISQKLAQRAQVNLSINLPPISDLDVLNRDCAQGRIYYRWYVVNGGVETPLTTQGSVDVDYGLVVPSGGEFSGSVSITALESSSQTVGNVTVVLPYTYQANVQTQFRARVYYGDNASEGAAVYSKNLDQTITSTARWRRLRQNSSFCAKWDNGRSRFRSKNNCNYSEVPSSNSDERWTYDPIAKTMINASNLGCARGNGDLERGSCAISGVNGNRNQWNLFSDGGTFEFRIQQIDSSELWCRIGITGGDRAINVRPQGAFDCSRDQDKRFFWGSDE